ncbi:uncharacterized protein LOC143583790 [Bidens hawaiensis]|uniref:uncharacterized protein LOC143583790 n=1 Tax=Bidens hawaiensis TaxID=980011 RepID=UPI0040497FDF
MEWSDAFDGSRNEITEYEVLEGLRPFKKLTSLKIVYYKGKKFPRWVGDPLFVSLTQLMLCGCRRCTCLPTLGHLPSLQKLFVKSMNELKRVGFEFLGPSNSCSGTAFPSLEVLGLRNMKGLEEWSTSCANKIRAFPCLRDISIINCPKLDVVIIDLIPSLQVLHLEQCSVAVLRSTVCASSSILRLTMENIKGLTMLHGEVLKYLGAVVQLDILEFDELMYLWESEIEACNILVNLQKLVIRGCENLVSLGEKDVHLKDNMEYIREVEIEGCPRLESYNCPNSIEKLEMYNCPSVTSLSFPTMHNLPSTLIKLYILACDNLQISWLFKNHLSSLESLGIARMSNF